MLHVYRGLNISAQLDTDHSMVWTGRKVGVLTACVLAGCQGGRSPDAMEAAVVDASVDGAVDAALDAAASDAWPRPDCNPDQQYPEQCAEVCNYPWSECDWTGVACMDADRDACMEQCLAVTAGCRGVCADCAVIHAYQVWSYYVDTCIDDAASCVGLFGGAPCWEALDHEGVTTYCRHHFLAGNGCVPGDRVEHCELRFGIIGGTTCLAECAP